MHHFQWIFRAAPRNLFNRAIPVDSVRRRRSGVGGSVDPARCVLIEPQEPVGRRLHVFGRGPGKKHDPPATGFVLIHGKIENMGLALSKVQPIRIYPNCRRCGLGQHTSEDSQDRQLARGCPTSFSSTMTELPAVLCTSAASRPSRVGEDSRIIYDFSRIGARHILMASFREEDVAAGKSVSGEVRLRQLISDASGGDER